MEPAAPQPSASRLQPVLAWWRLRCGGPSARSRSESVDSLEEDDVLAIRDPNLLRAVSVRHVLANFGHLLRSPEGRAADFEHSAPVENIDLFLSHSWQTPGWLKYCALVYKTNARRAVAAAILVQIVVHALQILHVFHLRHMYMERTLIVEGPGTREVYLALDFVIALGAFWLVLLWGHCLPGAPKTLCFLDKACIHQTDPVKKQSGVQMLGAFLRHSERMMVLWQPEYFSRAWCVFELAAFLHTNRGRHGIEFVPLKLPTFAMVLNLFHGAVSVGAACVLPFFARWLSDFSLTWAGPLRVFLYLAILSIFFLAIFMIPAFPLWFFIKHHIRDRQTLLDHLQKFSFAETQCFSADDHSFIETRITQWFGGIAMFEDYVRKALTQTVFSILVWQGPMPYRVVLFGGMPHVLLGSSVVAKAFAAGDLQVSLQSLCGCISLFAFSDAIAIALVLRLAAARWATVEAPEAGWSWRHFAGPLATAAVFAVLTAVSVVLVFTDISVLACVLTVLLEAAVAWLLYRGQGSQEPGGLGLARLDGLRLSLRRLSVMQEPCDRGLSPFDGRRHSLRRLSAAQGAVSPGSAAHAADASGDDGSRCASDGKCGGDAEAPACSTDSEESLN